MKIASWLLIFAYAAVFIVPALCIAWLGEHREEWEEIGYKSGSR